MKCGNGIREDSEECDDGNYQDDDGCSTKNDQCTVEEFYECLGGNLTSADICELTPTVSIKLIDFNNSITIEFDQEMQGILLTNELIKVYASKVLNNADLKYEYELSW